MVTAYCRSVNGNGNGNVNVNGAGGSSIINTCGDVNDLQKDKPLLGLGQDLSENIYILVCSSQSQNAEMDQTAKSDTGGCFDLWTIRGPIEALLRGMDTFCEYPPVPPSLPPNNSILTHSLFSFLGKSQPRP